MHHYEQARRNMLDCQLLTNGIIAEDVIEAFGNLPRELFLPENKRGMAYIDEDLPLDNGMFCMEPVIHARMVQAVEPDANDSVLNIGDMTGYSSAILSDLVSTVVTLESKTGSLDQARGVWDELGCCNIAVVSGAAQRGSPEHAPYDLIFINGAVCGVPDVLLEQLAPKGRLVSVIKQSPQATGCITIIEKITDGKFSTSSLFDAATPYVPGFEPTSEFIF